MRSRLKGGVVPLTPIKAPRIALKRRFTPEAIESIKGVPKTPEKKNNRLMRLKAVTL